MKTILWHGRIYSVLAMPDGQYSVLAEQHQDIVPDAKAAIHWLSGHSLRKGKARQLVDDELACNQNDSAQQAAE